MQAQACARTLAHVTCERMHACTCMHVHVRTTTHEDARTCGHAHARTRMHALNVMSSVDLRTRSDGTENESVHAIQCSAFRLQFIEPLRVQGQVALLISQSMKLVTEPGQDNVSDGLDVCF